MKMRAYERIMLGLSMADIIYSFSLFFGPIPAPKSTEALWAIGNVHTCNLQGFLMQFGVGCTLYNAALSIYFLLTIRYNIDEKAMARYEKWFHIVPIGIAGLSSVACLMLNVYNFSGRACWIGASPFGCKGSSIPCERGENEFLLRWLFLGIWLVVIMIVMMVCMGLIYIKVRQTETNLLRYNFIYNLRKKQEHARRVEERKNSADDNVIKSSLKKLRISMSRKSSLNEEEKLARKKSRRIAQHALAYCGAFFVTWVWSIISRVLENKTGRIPFGLFVITSFFSASQGIFTYLVFEHRRKGKDTQKSSKKKNHPKRHFNIARGLQGAGREKEEEEGEIMNGDDECKAAEC